MYQSIRDITINAILVTENKPHKHK